MSVSIRMRAPGDPASHLRVVRIPVGAVIAPLVEPSAVVVEALTVALVIVHDVEAVGVDLKAPDGHGVVDADVLRRMDGQVSVDWHVAYAALLLGEEHLLAPVRTENGGLEAAVILLVDQLVMR
jgi:hypothetical protein